MWRGWRNIFAATACGAPTAVASFSLSPIDAAVDPQLGASGRAPISPDRRRAQAKILYARYHDMLNNSWTGPNLADKGAR